MKIKLLLLNLASLTGISKLVKIIKEDMANPPPPYPLIDWKELEDEPEELKRD